MVKRTLTLIQGLAMMLDRVESIGAKYGAEAFIQLPLADDAVLAHLGVSNAAVVTAESFITGLRNNGYEIVTIKKPGPSIKDLTDRTFPHYDA